MALPVSAPMSIDGPMSADVLFAGRYRLERRLGVGGMATVQLAMDTRLERHVAVKLLAEHLAEDRNFVSRFRREALSVARLIHPNIVQVYDFGTDERSGRQYIAMEYVDGPSCAELLRELGRLEPGDAVDVLTQACRGLAYAHRNGVVHRDVKPENILVTDAPTLGYTLMAKLADFGVAQFIDGSRLTSEGAIMGTAAYISPEQARGQEVGAPSDVYSLGLVLLEALRGEREYTGSAIEAALARLHRPPSIPDDLPEQWQVLLAAMTADDPAARPTAHDVAATMRDIIRGMIMTGRGKHGARRACATGTTISRASASSPARTAAVVSAAVGSLGIGVALAVGAATGLIAR
jgi:eukaryotic-like serine/threonine-protein kinase